MSADNGNNDFALVPTPPSALQRVEPGAKRVLSGMVKDTLALTKEAHRPKHRIVLVDDDLGMPEFIRENFGDFLKDATWLFFSEGKTAWQELVRAAPDILITDLERPGEMDGWEMIPLLAERKARYPIIIFSASTKGEEIHKQSALALNGKDDNFLKRILAGEFTDDDLNNPLAWQTPSDEVLKLLQRVSPPLNIKFFPKNLPADFERLKQLIGEALNYPPRDRAK